MIYLFQKNIKIKRSSDKLDYTKLGPFKIKRKLRPVTVELKISERMRIHPVFYISLLKSTTTNVKSKSIDIDQEIQKSLYEVE